MENPPVIIDEVGRDTPMFDIRQGGTPAFGTINGNSSVMDSQALSSQRTKQNVTPLVAPELLEHKLLPDEYGPDVVGVRSFLKKSGKNKMVSHSRLSEQVHKARTLQRRSQPQTGEGSMHAPT